MKKLFLLVSLLVILSGCQCDVYHGKSFQFKFQAERYAEKLRTQGHNAVVYENNWYQLGGYKWNAVIVEDKK